MRFLIGLLAGAALGFAVTTFISRREAGRTHE